jgi:hypothetical protein
MYPVFFASFANYFSAKLKQRVKELQPVLNALLFRFWLIIPAFFINFAG